MAVGVGIVAAIVLLAKGLYPADLPTSPDPDFIDTIFNNRCVLWAARLLLVSAAGVLAFGGSFIVLSIGMRMKNREWLRRAGPFEISEGKVEQVTGGAGFWQRAAFASDEEVTSLKARLRQSELLIEELRRRR